jgi:hypothetical protein
LFFDRDEDMPAVTVALSYALGAGCPCPNLYLLPSVASWTVVSSRTRIELGEYCGVIWSKGT